MASGWQLDNGGWLLVDDGFAIDEDCCCCDPCTDALISQPNATVTINGSCIDQTNCGNAAGTYVFDQTTGGSAECAWYWNLTPDPTCGGEPGRITLIIRYNTTTKIFKAAIYGQSPGYCLQHFGWMTSYLTDVTGDLHCEATTKHISGTFDLSGENWAGNNCVNCTATVTVG